jgi:CRP/FNR family transcriptional regulator, cyclic AMP receptor protein
MSMKSMEKNSKEEFLRKIPLFSDLSVEELQNVQRVFQEKSYKKHQVIFLEEETGLYMYIVLSGKVKVLKSSAEGREHILAIHYTGEFFGEMSLLDGKTTPATIIAMEPCRLLIVCKEDFLRTILGNQKVLARIIAILCERLREAWNQLPLLTSASAEDRILSTLRHLAEKSGVRDNRGIIVNMRITHMELAEMCGTSRETATRIILKLQNQGYLDIVDHKFVLLEKALALAKSETGIHS